jgi:hypothetical protein
MEEILMNQSAQKMSTVVNVGLAIAMLALIGLWPGWRVVLQAQAYQQDGENTICRCEFTCYYWEEPSNPNGVFTLRENKTPLLVACEFSGYISDSIAPSEGLEGCALQNCEPFSGTIKK